MLIGSCVRRWCISARHNSGQVGVIIKKFLLERLYKEGGGGLFQKKKLNGFNKE